MDFISALLIIATGFCAGFINVVSGGGSLLSLPVLIFMGLPPAVANASNRIAVVFESLSGTAGYKSKGVSAFPYSLWLGLSALVGAVLGAFIAIDIKDEVFNRILAIIMICVVSLVIFKPTYKNASIEKMDLKSRIIAGIAFFFIGIYGGFIQAGAGFLIISALTLINKFSLLKSNSAKTLIVLIYSSAALLVFIIEGKVNWYYGLTLALGNASGAWVSSRLSVKLGEKWIKGFLIISVLALALKLWIYN